jgi:hypothetical protein
VAYFSGLPDFPAKKFFCCKTIFFIFPARNLNQTFHLNKKPKQKIPSLKKISLQKNSSPGNSPPKNRPENKNIFFKATSEPGPFRKIMHPAGKNETYSPTSRRNPPSGSDLAPGMGSFFPSGS